jgi:hypothetical protein
VIVLRMVPFMARLGPPWWKAQNLILQLRGGVGAEVGSLMGIGGWSVSFGLLMLSLVAVDDVGEALGSVLLLPLLLVDLVPLREGD